MQLALITAAFVVAGLAQILLQKHIMPYLALSLYGLAGLATIAALGGKRKTDPKPDLGNKLTVSRTARLQGLTILALALVMAGLGAYFLSHNWRYLYRSWLFYWAGVAAATYAFSRLEGWSLWRELTGVWYALRRSRLETIILVLILVLALFLRLYRSDYYPPPGGISWNDEAQIGKDAHEFLQGRAFPWQFSSLIYPVALSFKLFGETVGALRLAPIIIGFLTLIPFYLLTREFFGPRAALAGTFLFAVSRWHISFTKLVLPLTSDALLALASFYFLVRGWRTRGRASFMWAGLTMSLGLYGHASFRVIPIITLIAVLGRTAKAYGSLLLASGKEKGRRVFAILAQHSQFVVVYLVAALLFALPFAIIVRRHPHGAFLERFTSIMPSVFASQRSTLLSDLLQSRLWQVAGVFNYQGEGWGAVNIPGAPMLDPITGLLFVLGLVYCLATIWYRGHLLITSWFFIVVIGGGLLTIDFKTHRIFLALPAIYLLIAALLEQLWQAVDEFKPYRRVYGVIPIILGLGIAGWYNYDIFFHKQIHMPEVRQEYARGIAATANYIRSLEEDRFIYLFANFPFYKPGHDFAWMAGDPQGRQGTDIGDVLPARENPVSDVAYVFVAPYDGDTLCGLVKQVYPEAVTEVHQGPYNRYRFVACLISREAVEARRGLVGLYYEGTEWSGRPEISRRDSVLDFDWQADSPLCSPFSVQWDGAIYARMTGDYAFAVESDGVSQVFVDEISVLHSRGGERIESKVPLAAGWHRLRIRYSYQRDGMMRVYWLPPQGTWEIIPASELATVAPINGLEGRYYRGGEWTEKPVLRRLDPLILLTQVPSLWGGRPTADLEGQPYSVAWEGWLQVDDPEGVYTFQANSQGGATEVVINGEQVLNDPGLPNRRSSAKGQMELKQGWHSIEVRYAYRGGEFSGVKLLWAPPGGELEIVPSRVLRPPWAVIGERR